MKKYSKAKILKVLSKLPNRYFAWAVLFTLSSNLNAHAALNDYTFSIGGGIGGTGMQTTATIGSGATISSTVVDRSEGPLMFGLSVEKLISDTMSVGLEDLQGVRMGPFSSGEQFVGGAVRWYFKGPAIQAMSESSTDTVLFLKRYSPFVGYSLGVAFANISRPSDQVPSVTGSGIYYGVRGGVDYSIRPGRFWRSEMTYATTMQSSSGPATILSEFGILFSYCFSFSN